MLATKRRAVDTMEAGMGRHTATANWWRRLRRMRLQRTGLQVPIDRTRHRYALCHRRSRRWAGSGPTTLLAAATARSGIGRARPHTGSGGGAGHLRLPQRHAIDTVRLAAMLGRDLNRVLPWPVGFAPLLGLVAEEARPLQLALVLGDRTQHPLDLALRDRLAIVEALAILAADRAQERDVGLHLHPFRHHLLAELVRERHDRAHDRRSAAVGGAC